MQAYEKMSDQDAEFCEKIWLHQRDEVINSVEQLNDLGLHKQIVNRLLEPWMWTTVISTGPIRAWNHLFNLRCAADAEPHFQKIANMAKEEIQKSTPENLFLTDWHLPLVDMEGDDELRLADKIKVSVGRCARVSYLTFDGVRSYEKDIELHDFLTENNHWTPTEHQALPFPQKYLGEINNQGGILGKYWIQYRKTFKNEYSK